MPLPDGAPLSLQVHSNAVQSKPKRAMIVRLSAETLDALEAFPNHPPLSFDFGNVPGIHIGDAFFPMRPQKETPPHELYVRAASAAKPMAPLKLYANVVGKFMVEPQLDKVSGKVRQQTIVAKQQHSERQTILLDHPPVPPTAKHAKRKVPGSGTVLKKTPASDQLRPTTAPARKLSPLPSSSKANADVRRRLVHCLAISPRLAVDAVRMVGGAHIADSAREDLLVLLKDVAEEAPAKKGDKSPRPWALKPQTWTEVRPYEWPKLTEQERTTMARQARMVFKALKIPESDPAWNDIRYQSRTSTVPSSSVPAPPSMAASNSSRSSTTSAQPETKRSAITSKDAKLKSKQDASRTKGEVQMKDESAKATPSRVNAVKRAGIDRPTSPLEGGSAAKTIASRRLPGSGYQANKSPQPPMGATERSETPVGSRQAPKTTSLPPKPSPTAPPTGGSHARKTIPTMPPKPAKREDESDREREREYERQREREREKREREKERQREERERVRECERERLMEMEKREKAKQKEREALEREKQRAKEREREEMEQEKRQREKERIAKENSASGVVPTSKRKAVTQDTEEPPDGAASKASVSKRRKVDDSASVTSSPSKTRDGELPKKSAREPPPDPRLKMRKEPSSPQPSLSHRATTSVAGPMHKTERPSKANGGMKPRRRSPIYTSSEDEGEIPQPRRRNPSPPPVSDRSNSSDQPMTERAPRHHRPTRTAYPPATDHAALRALYQSHYSDYLGTYGQVIAQKRKLEAMLNGDSDAEMDVMDPDDLIKLSTEHKSLKAQLENIHELYTKGTMVAAGPSLD